MTDGGSLAENVVVRVYVFFLKLRFHWCDLEPTVLDQYLYLHSMLLQIMYFFFLKIFVGHQVISMPELIVFSYSYFLRVLYKQTFLLRKILSSIFSLLQNLTAADLKSRCINRNHPQVEILRTIPRQSYQIYSLETPNCKLFFDATGFQTYLFLSTHSRTILGPTFFVQLNKKLLKNWLLIEILCGIKKNMLKKSDNEEETVKLVTYRRDF